MSEVFLPPLRDFADFDPEEHPRGPGGQWVGVPGLSGFAIRPDVHGGFEVKTPRGGDPSGSFDTAEGAKRWAQEIDAERRWYALSFEQKQKALRAVT